MNQSHQPAEVQLFTDGACSGNPGPGGWAVILRHPSSGKELVASGAERETTHLKHERMYFIVFKSKTEKNARDGRT